MRTIKIFRLVIFVVLCLPFKHGFAQQVQPAPSYPMVTGFLATFVPVGTLTSKGFTANFKNSTLLGVPFGINLLKSDRFGYSMEFVPFILSQSGSSRMQFMLFHPGIMFRFKNGFTLTPRLAFQTDGRYGFTPVFGKVLLREKNYQIYVSVSEAARFGNNLPWSAATGFQLGVSF